MNNRQTHMRHAHKGSERKGFTLIEILIVVIILGILAAIVMPQFAGATQDAKRSALTNMVQSLRSQVALYRLQHNDNLPDLVTSWNQITQYTDLAGNTSPVRTATHVYGPYMQLVPKNPMVAVANESIVLNGTAALPNCGFVYDYAANTGSGKIWGIDAAGNLIQQ